MTTVHVVVPDGIDDPARPSGGNSYDRRLCDELAALGMGRAGTRRARCVAPAGRGGAVPAGAAVGAVPDGGLVLLDGLIASAAAAVLVPEAPRLRLVVLVHMPFGDVAVAADAECAVLSHARAVVTTSAWTRERLLERCRLPPERVHVARPGADRARRRPARPAEAGSCASAPSCRTRGSTSWWARSAASRRRRGAAPWWVRSTVIPPFVERLRRSVADSGLADRICFAGPRAGEELRRQYQAADVLVLPSRLEAYGMVVTEALAVGLPVIATAVGGVPEALGGPPTASPGLLVPPDDADALGEALGTWLRDAGLRARLRRAARVRRRALEGWDGDGATGGRRAGRGGDEASRRSDES